METTPRKKLKHQSPNNDGTKTGIWLDWLPRDIQICVAAHATAGVQSHDFFNLALTSKAQAEAVWSVSKKPVVLDSFLANDSFCLLGIGDGTRPTALQIARQFEGYDLHIGTPFLTPPVRTLLENTRVISWDLCTSNMDLISAVLRKAEAEQVTLKVLSADNLKPLFTRLASLPLKTLRLKSGVEISSSCIQALTEACHTLARLCPSLQKISLTELCYDLGSDYPSIERLPDCCEIRIHTPPPVSAAEKLGRLRSVRIELLCSDSHLRFSNSCTSTLRLESVKVTWIIEAKHGVREGLLSLETLSLGEVSTLYLCSFEPVFSSETLPHLLSKCRVAELAFINFSFTAQEWELILKRAGPHLRQLRILSSFCPSTSHFKVLTDLQAFLISILKYNHNLESLEFLQRSFCEPWTAPFASRAMVYATRALVGRVQVALPMLNEGKLFHSVDSYLTIPSQWLYLAV